LTVDAAVSHIKAEEDDSRKQLTINMTAGAYTCCIRP